MQNKILEQSGLLRETGAAISVAPNASRVLRGWGFDTAQSRMVAVNGGNVYSGTSMQIVMPNYYASIKEKYGLPIYSVHRVDLHDQLRELATAEHGLGVPCKLLVRAKVVDYVSWKLTSRRCSCPVVHF